MMNQNERLSFVSSLTAANIQTVVKLFEGFQGKYKFVSGLFSKVGIRFDEAKRVRRVKFELTSAQDGSVWEGLVDFQENGDVEGIFIIQKDDFIERTNLGNDEIAQVLDDLDGFKGYFELCQDSLYKLRISSRTITNWRGRTHQLFSRQGTCFKIRIDYVSEGYSLLIEEVAWDIKLRDH